MNVKSKAWSDAAKSPMNVDRLAEMLRGLYLLYLQIEPDGDIDTFIDWIRCETREVFDI